MATRKRVVWTPEATRTLDEVIEYVVQSSPVGARSILSAALESAESLSQFSERGRVVPEIADPTIREVFVYRYRLMYRVRGRSVEILAFIHGARDFSSWSRDR